MKVRFTRQASRQLETILDHIEDHSPRAARRLSGRIETIVALLVRNPAAGTRTDLAGQRRMPIIPYPYMLYDRLGAAEIVIQRIRHTSRRPIRPAP